MPIQEIFPNPTVRKVVFQITFPNLFIMESRIGEIQLKIMSEFPESRELLRKQIVFADLGEKSVLKGEDLDFQEGRKIWNFKSKKDVVLNITTNSLDISSTHHKTYALDGADKFRDVIKFVLDEFLEIIPIPIIKRLGLRYIDECPIPSKDNAAFKEYYDTTFPLDRFNLAEAEEMQFGTVVKKEGYFLRYFESLLKNKDGFYLSLDFDGYALDILPKEILSVSDKLHEIISKEFEKSIKEPVYDYMRQKE